MDGVDHGWAKRTGFSRLWSRVPSLCGHLWLGASMWGGWRSLFAQGVGEAGRSARISFRQSLLNPISGLISR